MSLFSDNNQAALDTFSKAFSNALKSRDAYTRLHSDRVMGLSQQLAIAIKLSEKEIKLLQLASAMHDIGKIAMPDNVLLKPSALEQDELEVMKTHPEIGARIIAIADNYDAMAVRRVYNGERSHSEIMHIMNSESGTKLDPHLFNLFTNIIEKDKNRIYQARQS